MEFCMIWLWPWPAVRLGPLKVASGCQRDSHRCLTEAVMPGRRGCARGPQRRAADSLMHLKGTLNLSRSSKPLKLTMIGHRSPGQVDYQSGRPTVGLSDVWAFPSATWSHTRQRVYFKVIFMVCVCTWGCVLSRTPSNIGPVWATNSVFTKM